MCLLRFFRRACHSHKTRTLLVVDPIRLSPACSIVYALAIWLPQARHSREGRQVMYGMPRLLDPSRELREAQDALDIAATPDNRLRLADALLAAAA